MMAIKVKVQLYIQIIETLLAMMKFLPLVSIYAHQLHSAKVSL